MPCRHPARPVEGVLRTRRTRPLAAAEQPPRNLSEPVAREPSPRRGETERPRSTVAFPPDHPVRAPSGVNPSRDRYTARPVRPSRARSATSRPPPSPSMRVPSGLLPAREYLSPAAAIPTAIGFRPRSRPTLQGAAPSFLDSAPSYACLAANRCPSWSRLPSRMFMLVLLGPACNRMQTAV